MTKKARGKAVEHYDEHVYQDGLGNTLIHPFEEEDGHGQIMDKVTKKYYQIRDNQVTEEDEITIH